MHAECFILFNSDDIDKHFQYLTQTKLSQMEIDQIWSGNKKLSKDGRRICKTPLEIAKLVCGNDFNPNHDWFKYTIYGVESSDNVSDLIYISDLVNWVEIDPDRIREYLDYDEEEELDELLGLNDDEDWEEDEDEDDNDE